MKLRYRRGPARKRSIDTEARRLARWNGSADEYLRRFAEYTEAVVAELEALRDAPGRRGRPQSAGP